MWVGGVDGGCVLLGWFFAPVVVGYGYRVVFVVVDGDACVCPVFVVWSYDGDACVVVGVFYSLFCEIIAYCLDYFVHVIALVLGFWGIDRGLRVAGL